MRLTMSYQDRAKDVDVMTLEDVTEQMRIFAVELKIPSGAWPSFRLDGIFNVSTKIAFVPLDALFG